MKPGFCKEWEKTYAAGKDLSVWPWSDLVSCVARHATPVSQFQRVLELGCGAGANIPFFVSRGFDYHGVDGSSIVVDKLKERFPALCNRLACGDFTAAIPFGGEFDIVVDRGSVICNDTASIAQCFRLVAQVLRPGGLFTGFDWFTNQHSESRKGDKVDECTRTRFQDGPFAGKGNIHFTTRERLENMLTSTGFVVTVLEHKEKALLCSDGNLLGDAPCSRAFDFVAVKK